jgi:hypothetical protein
MASIQLAGEDFPAEPGRRLSWPGTPHRHRDVSADSPSGRWRQKAEEIMKVHTSIAAAGAAALIVGGGAILVPAAASAHSVTHTLKFTAVTRKSASFSRAAAGQAENDINKAGKIIGFDVIYIAFSQKTDAASGGVTLDTGGGFLYGTLKFTNGPVTHGRVTGGTGRFKGATGTITGKNLNKSGTRTAVTITYHG